MLRSHGAGRSRGRATDLQSRVTPPGQTPSSVQVPSLGVMTNAADISHVFGYQDHLLLLTGPGTARVRQPAKVSGGRLLTSPHDPVTLRASAPPGRRPPTGAVGPRRTTTSCRAGPSRCAYSVGAGSPALARATDRSVMRPLALRPVGRHAPSHRPGWRSAALTDLLVRRHQVLPPGDARTVNPPRVGAGRHRQDVGGSGKKFANPPCACLRHVYSGPRIDPGC